MTERDIFLAVLDLPDPAARTTYLDGVCGGDTALRARVETLLRAHDTAGSFLGAPAVAAPESDHAGTGAFAATPDQDPESTRTVGGALGSDSDEALGFLAPPRRPDSLGRIGHYEVLEVLGRGGFGIVLRAFDEVLQRIVAVKVLAPPMAATSPARKRFLREARAAAQVRHENVVQLYAVEEQPLPYLVMEFIPGETLQQRLDRAGPLEVPEVLRVGRQVAEGLAAAHGQGLIHRDVKPANVLIEGGPQRRVKLTDFGLARAADDASISRSGVVAGTPMYMAPEQTQGESLDHRADLFSLGSVLYVMCTGRPPFRASGTMAVLKRVCDEDPRPIREVIPEVPEWLCRVVAKLHAKSPDQRFQTARAVADVLADCEAQLRASGSLKDFSRIPGGQPARPRRPRVALVAGALALLFLLAGAVWFGPYALLAISGQGEVVVSPEPGLTDVIVWRDGEAVTDWFDAKTRPTIQLPPGKYEFKPGFARGRTVGRWEVTTQGLFFSRTSWQGTRDFKVDIARGDRVTVRAVMRDDPSTDTAAHTKHGSGLPLAIAPFGAAQANAYQNAWANHLGVPVEFENTVGMKMRLIPPGEFTMGTARGELDLIGAELREPWQKSAITTEAPPRRVEIAEPFYLAECEAPVGAFRAFVEATGYRTTAETNGKGGRRYVGEGKIEYRPEWTWRHAELAPSDAHPVVEVSLKDAEAFCAWLGEKEGRRYAVPNEQQWEYACRGGTTTRWWNGDEEGAVSDVAWTQSNAPVFQPVGRKAGNPFGLRDMHGNVEEVCSVVGGGAVARGGPFGSPPLLCRSSVRFPIPDDEVWAARGFRVAIIGDLKPKAPAAK